MLNLLIKPFWVFGIDRVVNNVTGTEAFGLYSAMLSFAMIPGIFIDLGINQFNTGQISRQPGAAPGNFRNYMPVKIGLSLSYLAVSLPLGWYLFHESAFEERDALLAIMLINQVLAALLLFVRSFFSGLHLFKIDSFFSILDKLIMIILGLMLIYTNWLGPLSIVKFAGCQTIAYGITFVISLFLLKPHLEKLQVVKKKIRNNFKFFKRTWPYALLALLMVIYMRGDMLMLNALSSNGDVDVGKYILSFRLLDVINMVAVLTASLFFPIFSRMLVQKEKLAPILEYGIYILVLPAGILPIYCYLFGDDIFYVLYPGRVDLKAIEAFPWVMATVIPMCFNYIYGTLLTAAKKLRILNYISLGGIFLMIAGNLILVPIWGIKGTAVTALIVHLCISMANYYFANKIRNTQIRPMLWLHITGAWLLGGLLTYICFTGAISYLLTAFALLIYILAVWFTLGLAKKEMWIQLLRQQTNKN